MTDRIGYLYMKKGFFNEVANKWQTFEKHCHRRLAKDHDKKVAKDNKRTVSARTAARLLNSALKGPARTAARSLKANYESNAGQAAQLLHSITTMDAWGWANNYHVLQPLR
eukprot:9236075-Heterocapsa_arctica.AAC.1